MLENSYAKLPERFYANSPPLPVPAPKLLAFNAPLAEALGLTQLGDGDTGLAELFSGNELPSGVEPIALAYAGHQFGQFVPSLGDGRAVLLGSVTDRSGQRHDVQLKGSGRTPFSRGGDGKSSLGPVIREYILSEAMHALGVPTTRALAAVETGEQVYRERPLPGGVLARVASSHIRIGSFQYFAARQDVEGVKALADFAIGRHAPDLAAGEKPYLAFFSRVRDLQAELVAHWMDVGFIHGVMNTDNTTVSGETLDYGPCAFMDAFHSEQVFSSIDHGGRYAFDRQPVIMHWNLARLAETFLLIDDDQPAYEEALRRFRDVFEQIYLQRMRRKLGLKNDEDDDAALVRLFLEHLQQNELDYTLGFRRLADQISDDAEPVFGDFEVAWRARLARQDARPAELRASMNRANPRFVPRNHQVERAIQAAIAGDPSVFHELNAVLAWPYDEQQGYEAYATPPTAEEQVTQTFCGT